jgi:ribonucleoside-diphosphate reductase alpha chain
MGVPSPYTGVVFRASQGEGDALSEDRPLEYPAEWSAGACDMLAARGLAADGIPVCLAAVAEDDVPRWLWRHEADEAALAKLPADGRYRGETSAREVFDRIAGAWTYQGWKGGYFDSEADARTFFDEIRALLCRQLAAPEIEAWHETGLWWAYGVASTQPAGCLIDAGTGVPVAAGAGHLAPHGAFIHGVDADIAGEGGALDLLRREAALLAAGLGSGSNLSRLGRDGAGTLLDHLRLGAGAAALYRDFERLGPPARTVVVDADHPEAWAFTAWKTVEAQMSAAQMTGAAIVERHVAAIVGACRREGLRPCFDPSRNPALRFAIAAARQAMVPDSTIARTIALARQGRAICADDVIEPFAVHGPSAATPGAVDRHLLRADDAAIEDDDASPLDDVAMAAWSAGGAGLLFSTTADSWNTCPSSGPIRAVAGDGDFVFLDDTACGRAVLNLAGFAGPDRFDIAGFAHAARLMTIALDIAIAMTAMPTPRLARRRWEFRPVGLGITNLGGALMAQGIGYDGDPGRAFCAAACALLTGSAYAASAELAEEMGTFPGFARNRRQMLDVIANHRLAADGVDQGNAGGGWRPMALRAADCPDASLAAAARAAWRVAAELGGRAGFRNAQVSLIAPAEAENALFDGVATGVAPATALVRYDRLPGAGFRKSVLPAVSRGLRALGYGDTAIDAMMRHVAGHRTLTDAPGVNHEHLRRRGFTETALRTIEAAVADAPDIRFAFDRWTLGDRFCIDMLGFPAEALDQPSFDLLSALGFSEAAIEAANIHCCGADTLEGAPYIEPAHLTVFDCPRPLGERGRRRLSLESRVRMMAAAQPFISGGVGELLAVPADTSVESVRDTLNLAWRLGLKAIAVERDGAPYEEASVKLPASAVRPIAPTGRFAVVPGGKAGTAQPAAHAGGRRRPDAGGMSEALEIAHAIRDFGAASVATPRSKHSDRTDIGEGATASAAADAETSRRRSSHEARSAVSVPSSADAAVEQRQV